MIDNEIIFEENMMLHMPRDLADRRQSCTSCSTFFGPEERNGI